MEIHACCSFPLKQMIQRMFLLRILNLLYFKLTISWNRRILDEAVNQRLKLISVSHFNPTYW